jgi:hypothetical protein
MQIMLKMTIYGMKRLLSILRGWKGYILKNK